MPRVLVPFAEGFEEIETSTIVDVLRRAGVDVVLAGLQGGGPVLGARGIRVLPDAALADVSGDWDLVVLPGGMGNTLLLAASDTLKDLLGARVGAGLPVAAICAAPLALDAAGVLPPQRFTCYPGIEARLGVGGRLDERVVDDGLVITSQGPATAMDFALHLVGRLCGAEVRQRVAAGLLA